MYMDKDLIEDKLHHLIDQFNERKVNHRDFYFVLLSTLYIHFMMETRELVRYYSLAISIKGFNFDKTSSVVN